MSDLQLFRSRLQLLGRRRRSARVRDALLQCAALTAVAGVVYYLLDRYFTLVGPARLLLDVVWIGIAGWIAWRKLRPAWGVHEDEVDAALRLEHRRGIDADLVAALQFDDAMRSGRAADYGSVQLSERVVANAAVLSRDVDPGEEPLERLAPERRFALGFVISAVVAFALFYPSHALVFVQRVFLADAHYPTKTQIGEVRVDGRVLTWAAGETPQVVVAQGRPVSMELRASGVVPEIAFVRLSGAVGSDAVIDLSPAEGDASVFRKQLPTLVETLEGRFYAGDAYTEPFRLVAAALPLLTVSLEVGLPEYAAGADVPAPPPGRLSAAVLEGSDVGVRVVCANKGLRSARIVIGGVAFPLREEESVDVSQAPTFGDGRIWRLDPQGTPLAAIAQPLEFELHIEDEDRFVLPEPLKGAITLRPDQPPTVSAEVVTKYVLPSGKPSIAYQAGDDLGVQSLAIVRDVLHADGSTAQDRVEMKLPAFGPRTTLAGKFPLELASLELHKGDRVTIRVEARDRSGDEHRAKAASEPFTLEVTDEQGLY
ncbi:MAG: DUF4175 domain-containing protein, partial [Planctomycetia bacterium]|nr:DUF4175 domain-containing protein [Planctomycetia bacterium]